MFENDPKRITSQPPIIFPIIFFLHNTSKFPFSFFSCIHYIMKHIDTAGIYY